MQKNLIVAIILLSIYSMIFCQNDSTYIVTASIVQIDSSSLLNPLIDTIFAMDYACRRGTCNTNNVFIISTDTIGEIPHFIIIDGDCLSSEYQEYYSMKGISYYKGAEIYWFNKVPQLFQCHISEQQSNITFSKEEVLPIRDNIPTTYCYYNNGQLCLYKRTGCIFFNDNIVFPIILRVQ